MRQLAISVLLWFLAIGCGLIAGLYFAFSTFIMTSLGRIDQAAGISAMKAINADILRSLFVPLFFGTTLAGVAVVILALFSLQEPGVVPMIAGGILYVVGMFVLTMVFNVPLNETLATLDPADPKAASFWARYLNEWTMWNHVRTVASAVASALFIAAIAAR